MANLLQKTDAIVEYTLAEFINNLGFAQTAYRGAEADYSKYHSLSLGESFRIRKPVRHGVADGLDLVIQPTIEREATINIDQSKNIGFEFTTEELTFYAVEEFYNMYLRNDIQVLASEVDKYLANKLLLGAYHSLGVPGVPIANDTVFSETDALMVELGIPGTPRYVGIKPTQYHTMRSGMKTYFNPQLNKDIIYKGMAGELYQFDFYQNQNTPIQTAGIGEGGTIANGERDAGSVTADVADGATSITLDGFPPSTAGIFKAGDVVRFSQAQKINEVTKSTIPYPIEVVVQADASSDVAGSATITFEPALIFDPTSPYQNMSTQILAGFTAKLAAAPSPTSATTSYPYPVNMAYYEEALFLCIPPMPDLPGLAYSKTMSDPETNISIRVTHHSVITSGKYLWRLDIIYGGLVNGEYAVKVAG